jgi:enamine deaminase RidA (YjgF/YER057c/UK114 family)
MMMLKTLLHGLRANAVLSISAPAPALASVPVREPAPGGEVVSLDHAMHEAQYLNWHYAPARTDGPWVVLSGVVAAAREGVVLDVAGFEAALRRAFGRIEQLLAAAGSAGDHVVEMTTYHVFDSAWQSFGKSEHIDAFRRVKDEFILRPYPAWTAIGVADLAPQGGLVEIRVFARKRFTAA